MARSRWRSKRIGLDLDNVSRFNLMKTLFNINYFFPNTRVEVKATAHGYHIRIFREHSIEQNFIVRQNLGDDPMRVWCDEKRVHDGLVDWVDTLFYCKRKQGKLVSKETDYSFEQMLMQPFISKIPCRKT